MAKKATYIESKQVELNSSAKLSKDILKKLGHSQDALEKFLESKGLKKLLAYSSDLMDKWL